MPQKLFLTAIMFLFAVSGVSLAQSLQRLINQPPRGAGVGLLLTDGSVMFQGNNLRDWYKLTPDISGSYLSGTWSRLPNLPTGYAPYAFSSAVLADGRVVIVGGEYNNNKFELTHKGAIYDPQSNSWTQLTHPKGWKYIGDAPSVVLPDGKFLIGTKLDQRLAVLDPTTLTWTEVSSAGKSDFNSEEGWTLLPDGTVLTLDVKNAPNAEKYIPSMGQWVTTGSTIVDLHSPPGQGCIPYGPGGQYCYYPPGEIGPAVLRTDGTVFATGASGSGPGHTAIYTPPPNPTDPGTWTVGPDFPANDDAGDSYAALLPNGNVLVLGHSGTLYEFDGSQFIAGPKVFGSLLVLPTGQVIVGGSVNVQIYTSSGQPMPSWAPKITACPARVVRGSTYKISGRQFNGLSQAAAFGDEQETATNYPLVRITNLGTGHVFYARTHDHSTMAVATGKVRVSTNFDVPAGMETGASSLEVVANGIASVPMHVTVK